MFTILLLLRNSNCLFHVVPLLFSSCLLPMKKPHARIVGRLGNCIKVAFAIRSNQHFLQSEDYFCQFYDT
jgi:hypothetical protein